MEVHYAHLLNEGEIHANGGNGGHGGAGGHSRCDELRYPSRLTQRCEYGAPSCGNGGTGLESDCGDHCEAGTPDAEDGDPGAPGEDGHTVLLRDCNCNDAADDEDIATGVSEDCQPNDVPDECDIAESTSEDCNINIVPDECELPGDPDCNDNGILDECDLIFTASSPQLTPIGDGSPQGFTVFFPPQAVSDVTLLFTAVADLGGSNEYIDVDINGVPVGSVFRSSAHDCPDLRDVATLSIAADAYNNAVAGGHAVIAMVASSDVDADLCDDPPSWITTSVAYTTDERDCNENGIPDECEVPNLIEAWSVGIHDPSGGFPGGDIAFAIDLTTGLAEPRLQNEAEMWFRLTFDGEASPCYFTVTVSPDPGLTPSLAAGASADELLLSFNGTFPTGRYEITLSDAAQGGRSFPICYVQGDVNCSGDATGLDLGAIQNPSNWNKTLEEGASPRADVNRDGQVTGLDLGQVQSPTSWNQPVPPLTCTCLD